MTTPIPSTVLAALELDAAEIVAEVANTERPYVRVPKDAAAARARYGGYQTTIRTPEEG